MTEAATALGYLILVAAVGFLWALPLSGRRGALSPVMALAVCFPLGCFVSTGTWFVVMLAGGKLGAAVVLSSIGAHGIAAGGLAVGLRARLRRDATRAPGDWGFLGIAALLVLVGILAFQGWRLVATPYSGDGLGFWRPKACSLASEGTVRSPFFLHPDTMHTNRRYPLLLPLMQAGLMVLDRDASDRAERAIFPAFLISIFLLAYVGLRRTCSPKGSLFLLLVLAMATHGKLHSGYATAPMAAYILGTLVFLLFGGEDRRARAMPVAALMAAGMIFTKTEGLLYLVVLLGCLGITACARRRPSIPQLFGFGAVAVLANLPWLVFRHAMPATYVLDPASFITFEHLIDGLPKAPYVLMLVGLEMFSFSSWGLFWLVALWAFLHARAPLVLRLFPVACGLVWLASALLVPPELSWTLYTLDRFLVQMAMPLVLLAACAVSVETPGSPGAAEPA